MPLRTARRFEEEAKTPGGGPALTVGDKIWFFIPIDCEAFYLYAYEQGLSSEEAISLWLLLKDHAKGA